jgi:predicted MFS family arabinose efflux permease
MSIRNLWRTGGVALMLGFLTLFIGGGARHGIGLVLKPMAESLDWDRTLLGAVIAVFMVMTAFTMLAVGRLSDRYSPAWILSGGFFVSALGIGAMAFAETAWQAFLLYGIVFAIGNGAVSITPVGVMLTRRFGPQAGMANSIAIAGMGLGQLLILSGLSVVMVEAGWRDVFLWLGIINLIAAPLLLSALRREAPASGAAAAGAPATSPLEGLGLPEATRTNGFWLLMAFYAICGFQDFFVSSHVVAFALDQGEGALFAGNLLAFMGLAGLVGVLAAGAWSDRSGPVWPTLACFVLRIAIFALILVDRSPLAIAVFALGYGMTFWATAPLTVIFVRDLFGNRNLGMISGLVTMGHHIAGGLGALTGAMLFDTDGDYLAAFALMLVLSIIASAVTWRFARRSGP